MKSVIWIDLKMFDCLLRLRIKVTYLMPATVGNFSDANLKRYALRPNKQYWNICRKKAKIQIFDRKPQPNVYK
jgi:hypothetical protein